MLSQLHNLVLWKRVHFKHKRYFKRLSIGASLVAQWLRVHLPMQGTRVRALVREDPTCCRATKPVRHNCWACALEPASHNYWGQVPQLLKPTCLELVLQNKEKPPQWEAHAPQRRVALARHNQRKAWKACVQQQRPNTAKKKSLSIKFPTFDKSVTTYFTKVYSHLCIECKTHTDTLPPYCSLSLLCVITLLHNVAQWHQSNHLPTSFVVIK